ncbi:MAG: hypothetical protein JO089_03905, partial [Alphaproteobacteria bacterium]|nr:hypothetical protein [Alphaproteobacteria bacterium]
LPCGPVQSVTSVISYDRLNNATVIDPGLYWLDAAQDALRFYMPVPRAHRVEIVYIAGYGADYTAVPEPVRQGMLTHVASLYEHRGDADMPMPAQAIALYAPFREARL